MIKSSLLKITAALFAVFLALPASTVRAEEQEGSSSVEVINHVETGAVTIQLHEYELDENGQEKKYEDNKIVVPGEKISKIARITNTGSKAWIRASLKIVSADGIRDLSEDITVLSDYKNWKKAGAFWYCTNPLDHNESADFLKEVDIPETWTEEYSDKKFQIIIHVDAVQYAHFTPDFSLEDPWFGTVIETSVYDHMDIIPKNNDTFLVEYRGGAEGLIKKGDDFFDNWGTLLPGDVAEDFVTVQNSYASPVNIYFKTEQWEKTHLAEVVGLKIWKGEELIYDGNMLGSLNEILLARNVRKGEQFILRFQVSLPAELNNSYAASYAKTKWIFRTELVDPTIFSNNPRTADTVNRAKLGITLGVSAAAACTGIYFILKRRKEDEEKE